jgi:hypothetical protein
MVGGVFVRLVAVIGLGGVFASVSTWTAVQQMEKSERVDEARSGLRGILVAMRMYGSEY